MTCLIFYCLNKCKILWHLFYILMHRRQLMIVSIIHFPEE